MCRFAAYIGRPLLINDVMSKPKVSLIRQSSCATETDITLNGDGFGIAWYNSEISDIPAVFKSPLPAWNDMNLRNMSHQLLSNCFFAHVRASTEGVVNQVNCHPFRYQQYLMMHNGDIGGFKKIKLALLSKLAPQFFNNIEGQTDSEILFCLWLTYLENLETPTQTSMTEAWEKTLVTLKELQDEAQIKYPTYINSMITEGNQMIGIRYARIDKASLTLHYAEGSAFVHSQGVSKMLPKIEHDLHNSVLISSEKLTGETDEWKEVPHQHFIYVDHYKRVHLSPIKNT